MDYEKLNKKNLAEVDDRILKANFMKDSIRNKETVVKIEDKTDKDLEWQVIENYEESKNSEYQKALNVQAISQEEEKLHEKIKSKTNDIKNKYEEFEVLNDDNENITVKMPKDVDDNSFAIIAQKPLIEKPMEKS